MAMDMQLVKERLQPAYEFLAADGFGLEVAEEAGTLDITVTAGADACAECLVPKDVMTGILNQMLRMRAYGRAPDYVVVEADAYTPFFGLGGGAFITYSRSGQIFVAPEGGVGVPGAGVSVRAGWLDQDDLPSGTDVDDFIEGFAVTGSLGVGTYAVAATWNVGSDITDVSFEEGAELGEDPGSISLSYSADVGDAGCAWTD